jgi:hypothetical protein
MLSVVLDPNAEVFFETKCKDLINGKNVIKDSVPLEYGNIQHSIVRVGKSKILEALQNLDTLYSMTSGKPRIYLDNTRKFFSKLLDEDEKSNKVPSNQEPFS